MTRTNAAARRPCCRAIVNLSTFHREHEKFYAWRHVSWPSACQRSARTLQALADSWSSATASTTTPFSSYEGAEDLDSEVAIQLDGVLFMEGEGRPAEITSSSGTSAPPPTTNVPPGNG